jgi:hypothetical protein
MIGYGTAVTWFFHMKNNDPKKWIKLPDIEIVKKIHEANGACTSFDISKVYGTDVPCEACPLNDRKDGDCYTDASIFERSKNYLSKVIKRAVE